MTARAFRLLRLLSVVNMAGGGLMTAVYSLFLLVHAGVDAAVIGAVIGVGTLTGAVLSPAGGALVDRFGPKAPMAWGNVAFGAATIPLLWVTHPVAVAALLGGGGAAMVCNAPARSRYATAVDGLTATAARSKLRAASQLGLALGTAAGTVVLQFDGPGWYRAAIAVNAVSSIGVGAAMLLVLPDLRGRPAAQRAGVTGLPRGVVRGLVPPRTVLTNRRFMALAAVIAVAAGLLMAFSTGLALALEASPILSKAAYPVLALILIAATTVAHELTAKVDVAGRAPAIGAVGAAVIAVALAAAGAGCYAVGGAITATALVVLALLASAGGQALLLAAYWELSYPLRPARLQGAYEACDVALRGALLMVILPGVTAAAVAGTAGWMALAAAMAALTPCLWGLLRWAAAGSRA